MLWILLGFVFLVWLYIAVVMLVNGADPAYEEMKKREQDDE